MTLAFEETAKDKWGTLRGSYADDMSSKVATGIRFWAKSDVDGQVIKVIMVYNNMSWKYAAKVTIGKTGQYYEVPFSSMQLDYGTVTVQNGTDPQYINEWQFQPERKAGTDEATIFIDDISYIGDGPAVGPTDPPVTDAPTTPPVNKTDPPTTPPVNGGSTAPPTIRPLPGIQGMAPPTRLRGHPTFRTRRWGRHRMSRRLRMDPAFRLRMKQAGWAQGQSWAS